MEANFGSIGSPRTLPDNIGMADGNYIPGDGRPTAQNRP
jgi:hypothetical protein